MDLETPHGHDCARDRIEACVRQIQVICDEFGYDPCEWLNDETAQGDRPPFYHCNICGGTVNFPKGSKPSVRIGVGKPPTVSASTNDSISNKGET